MKWWSIAIIIVVLCLLVVVMVAASNRNVIIPNVTIPQLIESAKKFNIVPKIEGAKLIMIPHAALRYSGLCTVSCLLSITKKPPKIVVLCSIKSYNTVSDPTMDLGIIHKIKNKTLQRDNSYYKAKQMMEYFFSNVETEYYAVGTVEKSFIRNLLEEISKGTLVIVMCDIHHSGSRYKNDEGDNPRVQRAMKESKFMLDPTDQNIRNTHPTNYALAKTWFTLCESIGDPNIVCNYDLTNVDLDNMLNTLMINDSKEPFVSYLSAIVADKFYPSKWMEWELLSLVYSSVWGSKSAELPLWNPYSKYSNPAFVECRANGETIACMGSLKHNKLSDNVKDAAYKCISDSKSRWKRKLERGMECIIHILEPKKGWKKYPDHKPLKGKHGIYIETKDGKTGFYLAHVWKEHDWSVDQLLKNLLRKSGGDKIDQVFFFEEKIISSGS